MNRTSIISFPGLGIGEFEVNSVAFSIFGLDIAWYALIITIGMICAVTYTVISSRKMGMTIDDVIDYALFTIPIGVVGARLYYVLTTLDQYDSFLDVINIRQGGLAIYGGIIAGGLTVLAVSYFKKINFLAFADYVAPGVLLAQGIGRWGNFMNGEAYGDITDWFCRMGLQNGNTLHDFGTSEMVFVHPTFLYESLWNLLGVLAVFLFDRYIHKKYDGQLFLMIFGWYGFGRMFIEGLRTDSLYVPGTDIRISQLLAGIIFIVCSALLVYFLIKKPTRKLYFKEAKANANNNEKSGESFDFKAFFEGVFGKKEQDNIKNKDNKNQKKRK